MKLTPQNLKALIYEVLREQEADQRVTTSSMSGASFAAAGKDQRKEANPELSNLERGILQQIDQFLLDLAELPGVELNNKKAIIQRVMKMLQKQIVPSTPTQSPESVSEQCGSAIPDDPVASVSSDSVEDGEGRMAKSQLYRTAEYAAELEQMIEDGEELDSWVQAKITKASDYLSSVKHYLEYKKMRGDH